MATDLPTNDPIGKARRRAVNERQLGDDKTCVPCGENRPAALTRKSKPRCCHRCARRRRGQSTMDRHHPAGRANHPLTVNVPVNDHAAVLSEAQYGWPTTTLENPDGDPLLRAAACIRGFVNTVMYQIQEMLLWIAEFLERLSAFLVELWGRRWWRKTPLAEFEPKA